jgi:hypothetical protein
MMFETFGGLPDLSPGARGGAAGIAGAKVQGEGVQDVSIANRSRYRIGSGRGPGGAHGVTGKWQDTRLDDHPRGGLSPPQIVLWPSCNQSLKDRLRGDGEGHPHTPPKRGADFVFWKQSDVADIDFSMSVSSNSRHSLV